MPILRCLSDVTPYPAAWLWPGRIPLGALTLLIGDPGRGKSLVTLDLAARVTTGRGWPGAGPDAVVDDPGDVLLLSAEDSLSRTVRARLIALGADLQRVHYLNAGLWREVSEADPWLNPQRIDAPTTFGYTPMQAYYALQRDAGKLREAVAALPDCRLVVIDPVTAYLHEGFFGKVEEARQHVAPLVTLADTSGAAVVAVAHRDLGPDSGDVQRRQLRALATLARAIHLVDRLPHDPRRRVFAPIKNNLAEPQSPLEFELRSNHNGPEIHWSDAPCDLTAEDLLQDASPSRGPQRRVPEIDRACAWLQGALAAGPVGSRDLAARAAAAGIQERLLKRARERLGVVAAKHGVEPGCWVCNLPSKPEKTEGGQICDLSPLVPLSPLASFQGSDGFDESLVSDPAEHPSDADPTTSDRPAA